MGAVLSVDCERARARASLGLDGELSEVEQALLRAHVGRCADCAAYAHDLERLTQELRSARPGAPVDGSRSAAAEPARRCSASA
jgi:predicted anti-sigma-YlaC factor YlaD